MTDLPTLTWDQAQLAGYATARAFTALGIPPGTIRRWAHQGAIHPVGKAPGGAHLYTIAEVTHHATQTAHQPRLLASQTNPVNT